MIKNLQELLECGDEIYNLYYITHNKVTCIQECKDCRAYGRNINKYFESCNVGTSSLVTSKIHKYLVTLDKDVIDALNMAILIGKWLYKDNIHEPLNLEEQYELFNDLIDQYISIVNDQAVDEFTKQFYNYKKRIGITQWCTKIVQDINTSCYLKFFLIAYKLLDKEDF